MSARLMMALVLSATPMLAAAQNLYKTVDVRLEQAEREAVKALDQALKAREPQSSEVEELTPISPLSVDQLTDLADQSKIERDDYEAQLWATSQLSLASVERYLRLCQTCAHRDEAQTLVSDYKARAFTAAQRRFECSQLALPAQYGGVARSNIKTQTAKKVCSQLRKDDPDDPWLAYALWRIDISQSDLLEEAARNNVPPAIADWARLKLAEQNLSEADRSALFKAADQGDHGAQIIAAMVLISEAAADRFLDRPTLIQSFGPALKARHPLALKLAIGLSQGEAQMAYLVIARDQGLPGAKAQWLDGLEARATSKTQIKLLLQTYIRLLNKKDKLALQRWQRDGQSRPRPLIVAMQSHLKNLNVLGGEADGVWGKGSKAALEKALKGKL